MINDDGCLACMSCNPFILLRFSDNVTLDVRARQRRWVDAISGSKALSDVKFGGINVDGKYP